MPYGRRGRKRKDDPLSIPSIPAPPKMPPGFVPDPRDLEAADLPGFFKTVFDPKKNRRDYAPTLEDLVFFCSELAKCGRFTECCVKIKVAPPIVEAWKTKYPEFDAGCTYAMDFFRDMLEGEIFRRGYTGVSDEELKNGEPTGMIRTKFDGTLLALLAKKHDPQFKEGITQQINLGTGVLVVPAPAANTQEWLARLQNPAPPQQIESRAVPDHPQPSPTAPAEHPARIEGPAPARRPDDDYPADHPTDAAPLD